MLVYTAERKVDLEHCRQVLLRQMLPHTLIGHPVAAVLSRVGARQVAEWVHYETLPARAKRHLKRSDVKFNHSPELFWLDVFWAAVASIPQAFGYYDLASTIFMRGPWWVAQRYNSCGYYPRYTSGGVVRESQDMDAWDISEYLQKNPVRFARLMDALPTLVVLRKFAERSKVNEQKARFWAQDAFSGKTRKQIQTWLEADWEERHSHE